MVRREGKVFGTYRCPVCGHRDGAELEPGSLERRVECSYCGSPLELRAADAAAHRFAAQLAEAPAHG